MIQKKRLRLLLAAAAMATGALGELLLPALFGYVASTDGVIVLQLSFIGPILLGLHLILGEIHREAGLTQPSSVTEPEGVGTETPAVSGKEFQVRPGQKWTDRILSPMGFFVMYFCGLSLLAAGIPLFGLLSEFAYSTGNSAITLIENSSFLAGLFLVGFTACLRMMTDSHHRTMVKVSSVLMVLTALLWVVAQRTAYGILLGYPAYLTPSHYIGLFRLSSVALLDIVAAGSFWFAIFFYEEKARRPDTGSA